MKYSILTSIIIAIILLLSPADNHSQTNNTIIHGIVEQRMEAGMPFYYINNYNDKKSYFLGAPFEIDDNHQQQCIAESLVSDTPISISGEVDYKNQSIINFKCLKNVNNTSSINNTPSIMTKKRETGFTIYGVGFNDSYEDVIENGLKRGYKIKASDIPESYKGKVEHIYSLGNYAFPVTLSQWNGETNTMIVGTDIECTSLIKQIAIASHSPSNVKANGLFEFIEYEREEEGDLRYLGVFFYTIGNISKRILGIVSNRSQDIVDVYKEKYGPATEITFHYFNRSHISSADLYTNGTQRVLLQSPFNLFYYYDTKGICNIRDEFIRIINIQKEEEEKNRREEQKQLERQKRKRMSDI